MFTLSHVLLQAGSCALLARMSVNWLWYYIGVDMGLFFLFKIIRRDFFYFPRAQGLLRLVGSVLVRVVTKTMVNFTLMVQVRHPQEVGGLPFTASVLFSFAGSFVSAYLYTGYESDEDDIPKRDDDTLWMALGSLYAIWFASLVAFMSVVDRKYLHTFINLQTKSSFNK